MSEQEGNIHAREYSLHDLMNFLKNNPVFIPGFQRGFVWTTEEIKSLFNSIMNNDPIGSIILWKTNIGTNVKGRSFFNEFEDDDSGKDRYYILDGQQRLLSLFFLFNRNLFDDKKELFKKYCDEEVTDSELINFKRFFFLDKDEIDYDDEKEDEELDQLKWYDYSWFLKKLNNLRYNFIIMEVSFSGREDEIKSALYAFEKLNTEGKKLSLEDIFLAHIWCANPKFEDEFRTWRKRQRGTGSDFCARLDEGVIINTYSFIYQIAESLDNKKNIKLSRGLKKLLTIADKIKEETNSSERKSLTLLKQTLKSIEDAVEFIINICKMPNFEELPSQSPLIVLAIYLWYQTYQNNCCDYSKKELRQWFWRACLRARYSGRDYSYIMKDPVKMIEPRFDVSQLIPKLKRDEISHMMKKTKISGGSSSFIKSVKFVLLAEQAKASGGEDIFPKRGEGEEDHFFPKFLANGNNIILERDEINNIANLVFLIKGMNRNKSKKLPFCFLEKLHDDKGITKQEITVFLRANFIPQKYRQFKKQANEEKKFYDKNLRNLKRGIKYKLWARYNNFIKNRSKLIEKKLYALQTRRGT